MKLQRIIVIYFIYISGIRPIDLTSINSVPVSYKELPLSVCSLSYISKKRSENNSFFNDSNNKTFKRILEELSARKHIDSILRKTYYNEKGNSKSFCSGTFVDQKTFVFAAHCVEQRNKDYNLELNCPGGIKIPVNVADIISKRETIKKYQDVTRLMSDVAMIKFKSNVFDHSSIIASDLEIETYLNIDNCIVSGYGKNKVYKRGIQLAARLDNHKIALSSYAEFYNHAISIMIFDTKDISINLIKDLINTSKLLKNTKIKSDELIIISGESSTIQHGDSGGALLCKVNNKYKLFGIISHKINTNIHNLGVVQNIKYSRRFFDLQESRLVSPLPLLNLIREGYYKDILKSCNQNKKLIESFKFDELSLRSEIEECFNKSFVHN